MSIYNLVYVNGNLRSIH